jgi:acyl-CoA synthetase
MPTIPTRLTPELIERHTASGHWRSDTIYALAKGHAERRPDSFAARDGVRRITYRQLVEAADALAADLARRGVEPGQCVAVWLPSRIESVAALLACSRDGTICCPSLHRDHTVGEVVELLQRTDDPPGQGWGQWPVRRAPFLAVTPRGRYSLGKSGRAGHEKKHHAGCLQYL